MKEEELQLLKVTYRMWLQELEVPFSKKEKTSELEEKLILKGTSLSDEEIDKLSTPLRTFFLTSLKKSRDSVETLSTTKAVAKNHFLVDRVGFRVGSKRSYIAQLLSDGNWWTRPQLLEKAKKELGSCSMYTIDCVETYLRNKKRDLRVSYGRKGEILLKLYE